MKKTKITILTAILAVTLTNCMKKPVACIDAPTTGTKGQSITFTSCSTDAHHTEWDFGDGATASHDSPTHIYSNAGTYTVKIKAMSKNMKKTDEKTQTITIQ